MKFLTVGIVYRSFSSRVVTKDLTSRQKAKPTRTDNENVVKMCDVCKMFILPLNSSAKCGTKLLK
jgi:hypothetical protein